jgi:hypothetical protein
MTTETINISSGPYTGTGAVDQAFSVTFQSAGETEILVYLDGVLVDAADWSFARDDDGRGTVTATLDGEVTIVSDPSFAQETDFQRFGAFFPDDVNAPLDRAARRDQYLKGLLSSVMTPALFAMDRGGLFLTWDAAGLPTTASGTGADGALRADLAAANGGALVRYTTPGPGGATLTAQTKLRQIVNAADYGFAPNNTGAQNATALQAAIDSLDGDTVGGEINIAPGEFTCNTVTKSSNVSIRGVGRGSTIIKQGTITATGAGYVYGVIYCMAESSTTYIENSTISDLTMEGPNVAAPVFSQFEYLIACSGVRGLTIERVSFVGFQGDAIFFGGNANNTVPTLAAHYRHNGPGVVVRDCDFDGVNKENRAGISVLDCDGLLIEACRFKNVTKSTMPGPINIEPSPYALYVVKNITVRGCHFTNCGGANGLISLFIPSVVTTIPSGFRFIGNFMDGNPAGNDFYINMDRTVTATSTHSDIVIDGHRGRGGVQPFQIYSVRGWKIVNSAWDTYTTLAALGYNTTGSLSRDWSIENTTFTLCGSGTNQYGLQIGYADYGRLSRVTFDRCGYANASYAPLLFFAGGTTSNITIEGCIFIGAGGGQVIAIGVAGTLTPAGNYFRNNVLNGLTSQFVATGPGQVLLPVAFTWNPGNLVDGAGETSSAVTYANATFGDSVSVSAPYDLQGITLTAYVSSAGNLMARLQNETGGAIDLASGSFTFNCTKKPV